MLTRFFYLLFFCFSVPACQSAPTDLLELKSIVIHGNSQLSDKDIVRHLALDPSSKVPVVGEKRFYNASILSSDLARIPKIYEAKGIYGTQVLRSQVTEVKNKIELSIWVEEGTQVIVTQIDIEAFPLADPPALKLEKGGQFSEDAYNHDRALLIEALKNNGHAYAEVEGHVSLDKGSHTCRVQFLIKSPGPFRLGEIRVRGTKNILPKQIIEESDLRTGDLYSQESILAAEKALYRLDVFRLVEIKLAEAEGSLIPILISVDEGDFQTVGLGVGMGVATAQQEIRARIQYRHHNFFGGLRRFESEIRPAYIYVPNVIDQDSRGLGGRAHAGFFQPDLFLDRGVHHLGLSVSTDYQRDVLDGFIINSGMGRAGLVWPTNSSSNIEVGYNLLVFALIDYPSELQQCGGNTCLVSYFDQKLTWDRRDHPVNPRRGYWLSVVFNEAGLAGSFHYLSVRPEARVYLPGPEETIFAISVEAGTIFVTDGDVSPIPRRFYGGGPGSHRGFAMRRLSPLVDTTTRERSIPVGGNSLLTSSFEWRLPLTEKLQHIFFTDMGDVEEKSFDYRLIRYNYAGGIGLKYESPIAPIRFDVAYRLNNPVRFKNEPRFAFHLTLGDAF